MWKTLCYEARGNDFSDETTPCKDQTVATTEFGVNVICLADGCDSSAISHFGANVVATRAAEYVTINFDELYNMDEQDAKNNILQYVLRALNKQSAVMGTSVEDLTSTLLLVAIKENKFFSCYLGDGVVGYFVESEMEILFSSNVAINDVFVTSFDAINEMQLKRGQLNNIKGFALMANDTYFTFQERQLGDFSNYLAEVIYYNNKNKDFNLTDNIRKTFEEFIINDTQINCAMAILASSTSSVRYYSLSDLEKILFFKFPSLDENSINRVRDLDNILKLISTEKSIEELSRILEVEEKFLKRKMNILVECNLLSFTKDNVYKKLN